MADTKASALTEISSPVLLDYAYAVDASGPTSGILTYGRALGLAGVTPGGRLTLTSGAPVTTSDVTGATNIYYTPYVHDKITLWDGTRWVMVAFTEDTLALGTITSGKNYDVFAYLSSGALALEMLVWTNDTTRATAVTLQDGRYCKSGDKTRLYLGTFRTTSTTTTEDSGFHSTTASRKRFLWNAYNRVKRTMAIEEDTASWTYSTATTWRQWRAQADNQFEFVCGLDAQGEVHAAANATMSTTTSGSGYSAVGIGYDSTSVLATQYNSSYYSQQLSVGAAYPGHSNLIRPMSLGYHYLAALEIFGGSGATLLTTYGTASVARTTSMIGWVEA